MKIVALYKTFSGPEFVGASLASIYHFVDGVVMVHSEMGWDRTTGNTVRPAAEEWTKRHDHAGKVRHLTAPVSAQSEQYDYGLKAVREQFPDVDFVMVIDTDEVWDAADLAEAKKRLATDTSSVRFSCRMRTYVKSCFYRVVPPEFCHPTVFVRNIPALKFIGPRGSSIAPSVHWPDVHFHHFTYVRQRDEDVFAKVRTSTIGDGCRTVDLVAWKREKWDRIPHAMDLHTTVGAARSWSRVIEVGSNDLPDDVRDNPVVMSHRAERLDVIEDVGDGLPPISIIIPTCKTENEVAGLVEEINRRSTGEFEVIATCLPSSAAANRNNGMERARYDIVVMVDDDVCDLPYGWNQRLVLALIEENAAMASARLMRPDGRIGALMGAAAFNLGERTIAAERKLATACVAFRKTDLRFDESFVGSGFEDDDICFQMRKKNPSSKFIVENAVTVTHLNEMKNQRGEYHNRNRAHFVSKWGVRR